MGVSYRANPHLFALLAFFAIYAILVLDVRQRSSRDPGSLFFKPKQAFQQSYSLERQTEAEAYIDAINTQSHNESYTKASSEHQLCLGILTAQRKGLRYFKAALGSNLAGLTPAGRNDIYLISFIVTVDPALHQAHNESWPSILSDKVLTY